MRASKTGLRLIFLGSLFTTLLPPCFALDFEPRQWSHLPIGSNYFGVGYANSEVEYSIDPTIMLEDVELELETWAGRYIQTFELFDRFARFDLIQAYLKGDWTGLLEGVPASTSRSGFSDTFVRFAVNLYGGPPLSGKQFLDYRSSKKVDTIVGLAMLVRLPTGQYKEDKLINIGENRFTFQPQFGISHRRGKWTTELTGEAAFHTDNDDFFNGKRREQDPTYVIHGHLIYTFSPGFRLGASAAYNYVGENTIDGAKRNDSQENFGWALRLAYPFTRQSGFNLTYIGTRRQESNGFDSDTLAASLAFAW